MAYSYRAHCFVFHGMVIAIMTLTQGFHLGYLMNTTPNPHSNDMVIQVCILQFLSLYMCNLIDCCVGFVITQNRMACQFLYASFGSIIEVCGFTREM